MEFLTQNKMYPIFVWFKSSGKFHFKGEFNFKFPLLQQHKFQPRHSPAQPYASIASSIQCPQPPASSQSFGRQIDPPHSLPPCSWRLPTAQMLKDIRSVFVASCRTRASLS
ncbi:hypothetical protein BCR33DRAFT_300397 [Rhizoclosmatium globosum]|uniref:Uncharacterized protein n=1 Tax=Rhizoclosmatium globosum TaxID=329046 RepID=A0A1Y2C6V7_9FUNG|nr:hypothetical protein BCR33DRAFT_300397 [Rhizoclosmatium globosum]|eukprot:ORY42627.1 hypothetical protein BCR33DRAFT_300397 [Rhizoclosmatium globosum]